MKKYFCLCVLDKFGVYNFIQKIFFMRTAQNVSEEVLLQMKISDDYIYSVKLQNTGQNIQDKCLL